MRLTRTGEMWQAADDLRMLAEDITSMVQQARTEVRQWPDLIGDTYTRLDRPDDVAPGDVVWTMVEGQDAWVEAEAALLLAYHAMLRLAALATSIQKRVDPDGYGPTFDYTDEPD